MRALLLLSLLAGYQTKHFILEVDMTDSGNAKVEGEDNEVELGHPNNGGRKQKVKEEKEGADYSMSGMKNYKVIPQFIIKPTSPRSQFVLKHTTPEPNEDKFAKYNLIFIGKTLKQAKKIIRNTPIHRPVAGKRDSMARFGWMDARKFYLCTMSHWTGFVS